MSEASYQYLREIGREFGVEIHRPGSHQLHFMVQSASHLFGLCGRLRSENCYLVTLVANDERELEDDCFKIYYFFSHPVDNVFLAIEYSLLPGRDTYPSIFPIYPAVEPFEREIADLFGLLPEQKEPRVSSQAYLHACYPVGLNPLRRDRSHEAVERLMRASGSGIGAAESIGALGGISASAMLRAGSEGLHDFFPGELTLPIGPVHAGVIEPGHFSFRISGEIIDGLDIRLGYTHRGIERLYQRKFDLCTGWRLAEQVAGDSSFAHNVAYSKAIEVMVGATLSPEAHLLRALFLELERITNHIGSCAMMVQTLALEVPAAEMFVLREEMMALCGRLTGSRFLRGINQPGGIQLPDPLVTWPVRATVREITRRFLSLAQSLVERPDFRQRTIHVGPLSRDAALQLGITGLAARASGILRDFRIQHPFGPYEYPEVHVLLVEPRLESLHVPWEMNGDVFSRFVQRVLEIEVSQQLIEVFLDRWTGEQQVNFWEPVEPRRVPNYEWGLGFVEGWRGDIVYWVMKDKFGRIYRCKVRDASMLNWPGLKNAVFSGRPDADTPLADFPLILQSFHLSCAGNDL
jgi:Ni,Fe-hydrogenase III large subunit/Ni,Fe-hydrogenase III component G